MVHATPTILADGHLHHVLQCGLLEKFPEEAGSKDPAARIIPFLPGTYTLCPCVPSGTSSYGCTCREEAPRSQSGEISC